MSDAYQEAKELRRKAAEIAKAAKADKENRRQLRYRARTTARHDNEKLIRDIAAAERAVIERAIEFHSIYEAHSAPTFGVATWYDRCREAYRNLSAAVSALAALTERNT